jgi:hypothetical protein
MDEHNILSLSRDQDPQPASRTDEGTSGGNSQAQAEIYYDLYDPFLFDVGDRLQQALSSSFSVQSQRVVGGASPLLPILELVLAFTAAMSIPVAKSMLSKFGEKFGEDIYNILKDKFTKPPAKHSHPVSLILTVVTDELAISGSVTFDDYVTIADAIKTAQQMLPDASRKQDALLDEAHQGKPIVWRDKNGIVVSQSKLQFSYNYDTSSRKWLLKSIHKKEE